MIVGPAGQPRMNNKMKHTATPAREQITAPFQILKGRARSSMNQSDAQGRGTDGMVAFIPRMK